MTINHCYELISAMSISMKFNYAYLISETNHYEHTITDHSFSKCKTFSKNQQFLHPDKHMYVCLSGDKKCLFFRKFYVLTEQSLTKLSCNRILFSDMMNQLKVKYKSTYNHTLITNLQDLRSLFIMCGISVTMATV